MSKISETELQRRLSKVEQGVKQVKSPIANNGTSWVPTTNNLYIAYASALTNLGTDGTIPNQSDATDFGFSPFNATGVLHAYRGRLVTTSTYASGDPTDYIWELTSATVSSSSYVRYYTDNDGLLVDLGDPDNPGAGITWTSIAPATAIPSSAFWLADQYTIEGAVSSWQIYQVKISSSQANVGIISYTKAGSNKPVLDDATWKTDVLIAATAFTGLTYSLHTELGYGATVVITYDDGKLFGTLKDVATVATWVTTPDFIDGDIVVDGTVIASKLSVNEISAISADIGVLTSGSSTNGAVVRNSKGTGIYDTGDNLVMATGDLTYWTTTNGGSGVLKFPPATP
jgi:hypothetical protein